jgi:Tfp pilus assembly protein PilN
VWVGDTASEFVVSDGGRLLFHRRIALGIESLVRSLQMPIRFGSESIQLAPPEAESILLQHGIPTREDTVDAARGITGQHVLPLLQPALQRFVVELRQSLRFGLPDDRRASLQLSVHGPGSQIKGLQELVRTELGLAALAETTVEVHGARAASLSLLPSEMIHRRRTASTARWLWSGGALAGVLMTAQWFQMRGELEHARAAAAANAAHRAGHEALATTEARLHEAGAAVGRLESEMGSRLGTRAPVDAVLRDIAALTPESVRLLSIGLRVEEGRTVLEVGGYAKSGDAAERPLEKFMNALGASPLVERVTLGSVQREDSDPRFQERFSALLTLVTPRVMVVDARAGETP